MEILKLKKNNFLKIIKKISNEIKKGGVMVLPTDTVYGLIADATNKIAVEKVFKVKKREKEKPLPIFVKDLKMAKALAFINKEQEKFLKKVWPGKVTVVLKRKKTKLFGVDKKTIGLRVPNYKFINQLLMIINSPLIGTSANISGEPASTKIKEVLKQFEDQEYQPDFVLNVGNLAKGRPSVIIDLTEKEPKILRY